MRIKNPRTLSVSAAYGGSGSGAGRLPTTLNLSLNSPVASWAMRGVTWVGTWFSARSTARSGFPLYSISGIGGDLLLISFVTSMILGILGASLESKYETM